jgi:hypothetical protein
MVGPADIGKSGGQEREQIDSHFIPHLFFFVPLRDLRAFVVRIWNWALRY